MPISNQKNGAETLKPKKKMALGKGLSALIPDMDITEEGGGEYFLCDIDLITPNRFQPRVQFSEEELSDLCQSIKEQGIIQPLVVRKDDHGYELIAGERRLRASKMAGLTHVPVIIKEVSDTELLEISIVENVQRENLNPIEEAEAYQRLMDEFHLTQEKVASRVGKSRSAIANFLRLRQLPSEIKETILSGMLSMGHARALLGTKTPLQLKNAWKTVISKQLSVRQTEALVKRLQKDKEKSPPLATSDDIYFKSLSSELSRHFGTKVQIIRKGQKGRVEIEFYSNDDLDRLLSILREREA